MIVLYAGEVRHLHRDPTSRAEALTSILMSEPFSDFDYVVLAGGFGENVEDGLLFLGSLRECLGEDYKRVRFIIGSPDMRLTKTTRSLDNRKLFFENLDHYSKDPAYFLNSPILYNNLRITGFQSWYDYTFYRGKASLKTLEEKRTLLYRHPDAGSFTVPGEYAFGMAGSSDMSINYKLTEASVKKEQQLIQSYGYSRTIMVGYFKPLIGFAGNTKKLASAYEGSESLAQALISSAATTYFFGKDSDNIEGSIRNNDRQNSIYVRCVSLLTNGIYKGVY